GSMEETQVMNRVLLTIVASALVMTSARASEEIPVDLSGYDPSCGVDDRRDGPRLTVAWPIAPGEFGRLVLDLRPGRPLIERLGVGEDAAGPVRELLKGVDPVTYLTVGTRVAPPGRPPGMSVFNVFFDSPAQRPHQ